MALRIVVMGVSGCGKSTLAQALAQALQCPFIEGDALHPQANRDKMAAGLPLDDTDRGPFLQAVATALQGQAQAVAACSALRRRYRDLLRDQAGPLHFVLPVLDESLLRQRLALRQGHFMPARLLDSQLASFETPTADEPVITVDARLATAAQVQQVLQALALRPAGDQGTGR